MVEHDVVGRVVGLADFLQHHRALALQLLLQKSRVLQDVCHDVEAERRVLRQHLGIEGGVLAAGIGVEVAADRSEEHTSELQSLMRISYAVFCLKKKKRKI